MRFTSILRTAFAFAAFTALGGPLANADLFLWMGGSGAGGADWCNEDNWVLGRGYPGQNDTADMVLIAGVSTQAPVLDCAPAFPVSDVFVFGGGNLSVSQELIVRNGVVVNTGGSLTVSGTMSSTGPGPHQGVIHSCEICVSSLVLVTGTFSTYCKLTIKPGGELRILAGGVFEQTQGVTDEIGGKMVLEGHRSTFRIKADVVLGPYTAPGEDPAYGEVRGEDPDARIQIQRGHMLTNDILIRGMMTIEPAPEHQTAGHLSYVTYDRWPNPS